MITFINILKLITILLLSLNYIESPHFSAPFLYVFFMSIYIFLDFKNAFLPFLATLGLVIIIISMYIKKNRLILTLLGYFLTYAFLLFIISKNWQAFQNQLYFSTMSVLYFITSFIVIILEIVALKKRI